MVFVKTILTPENTSKTLPMKTQWKLVPGLIYRVELYYPPGSSGLCGVAIQDSSVRLYPYGEQEWFIGDNVTIGFDDIIFFNSATAILDIHTYNLDDTYDHTVQIRLGIESDETVIKHKLGISSSDALTAPLVELIQLLTLQNSVKKSYNTEVVKAL